MFMYVHIHICKKYIYIYIYIYTHVCMRVCVYVCIYIYIYISMYACTYNTHVHRLEHKCGAAVEALAQVQRICTYIYI